MNAVDHNNVVNFDDRGIPSIMCRFVRPKDAEEVPAVFKIGDKMDLYSFLPNSSQIVDLPIRLAPSIRKAFLPFSSFFSVSSLLYILRFSIITTPHFNNTQVRIYSQFQ